LFRAALVLSSFWRAMKLHDALKTIGIAGAIAAGLLHLQHLAATVQYHPQRILRNVLYGCGQLHIILGADGLQLAEDPVVAIVANGHNAALVDAFFPVGDDEVLVHLGHRAQPVAIGTCTIGRVEGEEVRCRFIVGDARGGTHQKAAVEARHIGVMLQHHHRALALLHGQLQRLGKAFARLLVHLQAVHHHLDVVGLVAVQLHVGLDVQQLTVHPHLAESLLPHLFEEFAVMPLSAAHHGRKDVHLLAAKILANGAQYLIVRILHHPLARVVAECLASAGIQQSDEVIHLGDGAHGAARVAVGALLLDADHGAQPGDLVHIRPLQRAKELARIAGKGLDVSPLTLRHRWCRRPNCSCRCRSTP
jgi:hypothetical protein